MKNAVSNEFPWNNSSLVEEQYSKLNYKVIETGNKTGRAICFFSGNGLYYPNDTVTFRKEIINKDRYEFEKIGHGKLLVKYFEKIIFFRDIYKQWYVTGINNEANSIDKSVELISKLTEGLKVTTAGISAGGYAAVVLGKLMGANRIFDISGQWCLDISNNTPFLQEYSTDSSRAKYYDARTFLDVNNPEIFYFFPGRCEEDIIQNDYVRSYTMNRFAVDTEIHGALLRYETFKHLFITEDYTLKCIEDKYKGKLISAEKLFREIVPFKHQIMYRTKHFIKMVKNRVHTNEKTDEISKN